MSEILRFELPSTRKQEFIFQVENHRITMQEDKFLDFPCIVLYHRESGIPAGYPGYERWLYEMNCTEEQKSGTLRKKACNLCAFLNFLLWNTDCDMISDVSLREIRDFFIAFKKKSDGDPRDPQEWFRGISDVLRFMHAYIVYHKGIMQFKMDPEDLITFVRVSMRDGKRVYVVDKAHLLYVKPPIKEKKKFRFLLHGHLDLLLFEARKYDPMILPAIMLQAFAGLREGEVVNCTFSNVTRQYVGFGRIGKIVIDLTRPAAFAESYEGKTSFGEIKRFRKQEVYPDFIERVIECLDKHEMRLQTGGYSLDGGAPLLVNSFGKPMSVFTYTSRLKILFYSHFLPDLKKFCKVQGTWAEQAPYIEAYENEYPGAHMLRHWYTMYLLEYTTLKQDEVAHWRGDKDVTSMADYIHINSGIISAFREAAFSVQETLLEEVL